LSEKTTAAAMRPVLERNRFNVTLSRDIRDLRPVKTREGYQEMAAEETGPEFALLAAEFLLDVLIAQNLVILKTSPGHANSVAVSLDGERWPGVVGTIAGDDTILVIAPDSATAESVQEKLLGMLERG
jgi:transcriptional regulator of arginine metabolism